MLIKPSVIFDHKPIKQTPFHLALIHQMAYRLPILSRDVYAPTR